MLYKMRITFVKKYSDKIFVILLDNSWRFICTDFALLEIFEDTLVFLVKNAALYVPVMY